MDLNPHALASRADRITLPRTGAAGSIGVISMHTDMSGMLEQNGVAVTLIHAGARKADGNPHAALPEGIRDRLQSTLEDLRILFAETVAAGRGARMTTRRWPPKPRSSGARQRCRPVLPRPSPIPGPPFAPFPPSRQGFTVTIIRNPFDAGGHSLAEMTQAINILPDLCTRPGELGRHPDQGPRGILMLTLDLSNEPRCKIWRPAFGCSCAR